MIFLRSNSSLEALRGAISRLIDIPLENLILFHSSGSQLSESLYKELGNLAAAESVHHPPAPPQGYTVPGPRCLAHRQSGQTQYDLNGNEIRLPEAEDKGGLGVALYAFDRESFMAEPYEFVKGIEEDLVLPEPLPSGLAIYWLRDVQS